MPVWRRPAERPAGRPWHPGGVSGTSVPGRPRLATRRRPGLTPREEVLDAAGELFTTRGYAATSTRRIAEAVGMRQPSLYHHFRTKDDILEALLSGTVTAPLAIADALDPLPLTAPVRLYALCLADAGQLWTSPWNLGILYLLPEVRTERFARFHRQRDALRLRYRALSQAVLDALPPQGPGHYRPDPADDTVFRLTETLPNLRADGQGFPDQPRRIADLALHTLGWPGDPGVHHDEAQRALDGVRLAAEQAS
ncbi:TetR/AcrR family transcriptional regulator [Streptomyces triticirhizae]|uniref:TetR/AcrR family transcriptional regulator n=1 Tax=Streptomyces triticirhizae TaxID=2483353 RepID=A0A3M2LPW2_9ACTN|nr:TetR/AcrR family transcriptional regulator [Streptomyces triticirhizae]